MVQEGPLVNLPQPLLLVHGAGSGPAEPTVADLRAVAPRLSSIDARLAVVPVRALMPST